MYIVIYYEMVSVDLGIISLFFLFALKYISCLNVFLCGFHYFMRASDLIVTLSD